MKKLITLFISALALVLFTTQLSSFAASKIDASNVIGDPLVVVTYDGTKENPIRDYIDEIVKEAASDLTFKEKLTFSGYDTLKLANDMFVKNEVMLVATTVGEDEYGYFIFDASQSDLDDIVETIYEYEALEVTDYEGHEIYSSYKRNDFSFVYMNGVILATEKLEDLQAIVTNIEEGNSSTSFQTRLTGVPSDSFFTLYLDVSNDVFEQFGLDSMDYEWISASQASDGQLEFESYAKGNKSKFDAKNFSYSKFAKQPTLLDRLPGGDLVFYMEVYDFVDYIEEIFNTIVLDTYTGSSLFDELGIDADEYELFNGSTAIQVQLRSDNAIPYITFATELDGQTSKAQELNDTLTETFETEPGDFTTGSPNTYTFDMQKEEPTLFSELPEFSNIKITYGILNDLYIISSNPNIVSEIGQSNSVKNNQKFKSAFGSNLASDDIISLMYLDFKPVEEYYSYLSSKMPEEFASSDAEVEQFFDIVNANPWYAYSTADEYSLYQFGKFSIDTDAIIDYLKEAQGSYSPYDSSSFYLNFYEDVDADSWYAKDVAELTSEYIIRGDDGSFITYRPNDSVTRAEFVTMIVRLNGLSYEKAYGYASSTFSDVNLEDWFEYDLSVAHSYGIIEGNEDGTFRPNAPINRAEAVKMLENASGVIALLETNESLPFSDVSSSDWFYEAVQRAYAKDVVRGTTSTTFEPAKTLNRAEAAALINRIRHQQFNLGIGL